MTGQDVTCSAEQASRLARIRERVREGVWGLRHEGHWDWFGRGIRADGVEPETSNPETTVQPCQPMSSNDHQ